jgi:hypothetical protein
MTSSLKRKDYTLLQELRIDNLPLALGCILADTEVCMPTGVHGNVSQF